MDKASKNIRYLEHSDMSEWNIYIDFIFETVLFNLEIPPTGHIVEMGTFRCFGFDKLCSKYGVERCLGYDVVNYEDKTNVIEKDVRDLSVKDDLPIAIGWNDVSNWKDSPQSKMAAAQFLMRNILPGGLYIDENFKAVTANLNLETDFEYVYRHNEISIFRKRAL